MITEFQKIRKYNKNSFFSLKKLNIVILTEPLHLTYVSIDHIIYYAIYSDSIFFKSFENMIST